MAAALVGDGAPPHELKKYMLAAGVSEVHGLGAAAVYGRHPILTYREFEQAWAIQQTLLEHMSHPDETERTVSIRRTIDLEKQGLLDDPALFPMPQGIPFDPGPAG